MSFLPAADRAYLAEKGIAYEEKQDGAVKGVILKGRRLPDGRFDSAAADILIQLPPGYPDVAPDMFYLLPWVKLRQGGRYPNAANVAQSFAGQSWQRWSRHNSEWRPGIDGIWTMIKRVEDALEKAA